MFVCYLMYYDTGFGLVKDNRDLNILHAWLTNLIFTSYSFHLLVFSQKKNYSLEVEFSEFENWVQAFICS